VKAPPAAKALTSGSLRSYSMSSPAEARADKRLTVEALWPRVSDGDSIWVTSRPGRSGEPAGDHLGG
ncbi:hypothetical protein CYMTET_15999, partial [Cymbomonas tetramitiformis]